MDKQIRELNKKIAALEKKINDAQNQIDRMEKIKQENGKLTAKVNIQGSTLEINDIKVKGDTYTSSFYVDGTPVDLTMTQKGNKLEGMADAGGMQIPVKFKKTKK